MLEKVLGLLWTPKTQMGFLLFIIFVTSVIHYKSLHLVIFFLTAICVTVFFDLLFLKIRKVDLFFPSAALVSGSIIGLIASPSINWYQLIFVCILAMFSKNFIRSKNKHIFNPAAFGIFISHFLFGQSVSWWAVSFQQLRIQNLGLLASLIALLLPAYISIYRMRRYLNVVTFYLAYLLVNKVANGFFDPTLIFFSFVMLPEPMTTPSKPLRQFLFAIFVLVIAFFTSLLRIPDIFIAGLLLGNLVFFII